MRLQSEFTLKTCASTLKADGATEHRWEVLQSSIQDQRSKRQSVSWGCRDAPCAAAPMMPPKQHAARSAVTDTVTRREVAIVARPGLDVGPPKRAV